MDFTSNRFPRRSALPRFDGSVDAALPWDFPTNGPPPTRSHRSASSVGAFGRSGPRAYGLVAFI